MLAHNKTLAAQLCEEFRAFFPDNAVEYFVSYYDYYQPEAYIAHTDTFIEKDASINDEIERLRHSATAALFERRDVIVVASVSLHLRPGRPRSTTRDMVISLRQGQGVRRATSCCASSWRSSYDRNDVAFERNMFRVRGDTVEIYPVYAQELPPSGWSSSATRSTASPRLTPSPARSQRIIDHAAIYPASHYVDHAREDGARHAGDRARAGGAARRTSRSRASCIEAQRIEQRTRYDVEMMRELGYCTGIENYSRVISRARSPARAPCTLMDYFPDDFVLFVDESHVTLPQVRAMYNGDRARKESLVEYGFRLPSRV